MLRPSGDQVGELSDFVESASVRRRSSWPETVQMSPARLKTMVPLGALVGRRLHDRGSVGSSSTMMAGDSAGLSSGRPGVGDHVLEWRGMASAPAP
jgi:hypothetical protein